MKRPSIHTVMMAMASVMSHRAICPRRKVGAVFTDSANRVLATGYNGSPRGWTHCVDVPCAGAASQSGTDLDLCEAVHAEANALAQCRNNDLLHNLYVTTVPCVACVKLLINTPLQHIYYAETYPQADITAAMWCRNGRTMTQIKSPIRQL